MHRVPRHGAKPGSTPVKCRTCDGHGKVLLSQGFFAFSKRAIAAAVRADHPGALPCCQGPRASHEAHVGRGEFRPGR